MKRPKMQVSAVLAALLLAGVACVQANTAPGTSPLVVVTPTVAPVRCESRLASRHRSRHWPARRKTQSRSPRPCETGRR